MRKVTVHKAAPNDMGRTFFVIDDATGKEIDGVYQFTAETTEQHLRIALDGKNDQTMKTGDCHGVMRFFDGTEERVIFNEGAR